MSEFQINNGQFFNPIECVMNWVPAPLFLLCDFEKLPKLSKFNPHICQAGGLIATF